MENHYQLDDDEFEKKFEDCSLNPSLFSHEAHIRLAWIHVTKYGSEKACKNICEQISQFDQVHGKGEKFHVTITVASVKAVAHFVQKYKSDNFQSFINEFPRLNTNFKELIDFHYGFDILNSELAKKEYLAPDLMPFE